MEPASKVLVCDIPELCDENGHFVGKTVCDIPQLCDANGNFVGSSITIGDAAREIMVFDFG